MSASPCTATGRCRSPTVAELRPPDPTPSRKEHDHALPRPAQGHPARHPAARRADGAIMKLGEEATAAGALLDNAGLAPSAAGARVSVSGDGG